MARVPQIDRTDPAWVPDDRERWSGPPVIRDRARLHYPEVGDLGEVPPAAVPPGAGLGLVAYRPVLRTNLDGIGTWRTGRLYGYHAPPRAAWRTAPRSVGWIPQARPPVEVLALPVESPWPAPSHPREVITDPGDPDESADWHALVEGATDSREISSATVHFSPGSGRSPASLDTLTANSLRSRILCLSLLLHGKKRLATRLQGCGQFHRAVRVKHRGGCPEDHGEIHVQHSQCGVVGCPRCEQAVARDRAHRLAGKLAVAWVGQPKAGRYARHLVLSMRTGLQAGMTVSAATINLWARQAKQAFSRWWSDHVLPAKWGGVPGATYKIEVGPSGNVHLHVATLGMRWIDQGWLSRTWEACGGDPVVWVTGAHNGKRKTNKRELRGVAGLVAEVSKYITKPQGAGGAWWLAPLVAVGLHGVRVWETFGALRGVAAQVDAWIRYRYRSCEFCGSHHHIRGRWMRSPDAALESLSWRESHPRAPPREEFLCWWAKETSQTVLPQDPWSRWDGTASSVHRPTVERAARKAWGYFWRDEPTRIRDLMPF